MHLVASSLDALGLVVLILERTLRIHALPSANTRTVRDRHFLVAIVAKLKAGPSVIFATVVSSALCMVWWATVRHWGVLLPRNVTPDRRYIAHGSVRVVSLASERLHRAAHANICGTLRIRIAIGHLSIERVSWLLMHLAESTIDGILAVLGYRLKHFCFANICRLQALWNVLPVTSIVSWVDLVFVTPPCGVDHRI